MQPLRHFLIAFLLLASPLAAQRRPLAERLGHAADAKLLILHADDVGVAHSVNVATFEALDRGAISSASIMMPTPWITEVAAYARAHPEADLGLHLTITSEWDTYRWGSVASSDRVPSLLDSAGAFPSGVRAVVVRAKASEVEHELRAQVERALAVGIRPTHLDSHMAALFATPELIAAYIKVARAYRLPFLTLETAPFSGHPMPLAANDIVLDTVIVASPDVPRDRWKEFYLDAIANLRPGLSMIIVHLGRDDAELQAVTVNQEAYGSAWRQRDYDVVTSAEFKAALAKHGVVLVTWRELHDAVQQRP